VYTEKKGEDFWWVGQSGAAPFRFDNGKCSGGLSVASLHSRSLFWNPASCRPFPLCICGYVAEI